MKSEMTFLEEIDMRSSQNEWKWNLRHISQKRIDMRSVTSFSKGMDMNSDRAFLEGIDRRSFSEGIDIRSQTPI